MKITEEVHAAASRAAEDAYLRWYATPNRDAYVSGFIAAAAKNAVEAVAPLIAAQELRGAADLVDRGPAFPLPPSVISALLRERADDLAAPSGGPTGGTPND